MIHFHTIIIICVCGDESALLNSGCNCKIYTVICWDKIEHQCNVLSPCCNILCKCLCDTVAWVCESEKEGIIHTSINKATRYLHNCSQIDDYVPPVTTGVRQWTSMIIFWRLLPALKRYHSTPTVAPNCCPTQTSSSIWCEAAWIAPAVTRDRNVCWVCELYCVGGGVIGEITWIIECICRWGAKWNRPRCLISDGNCVWPPSAASTCPK